MLILKQMRNWGGEEWVAFGFIFAIASVVAMIGFCVISNIASDDRIEHCYVEQATSFDQVRYEVKGYRSWDPDLALGHAASGDEAHQLMLQVCPVEMAP